MVSNLQGERDVHSDPASQKPEIWGLDFLSLPLLGAVLDEIYICHAYLKDSEGEGDS